LSQIFFDMQGLTFNGTRTKPEGIPFFEWTLILDGTTQFIQDHGLDVFNPPPRAGWVVTHNGNEPTQTATDTDIVIIPNSANPGASTLVFAMMIGSQKLPSSLRDVFTNVSLIDNPDITPGVALIRAPRSISFMQNDLMS
jgi:hypothetical protein